MHRLRSALLAAATAGAIIAFAPVARAQEAAVTGPCAQPDSIAFTGNQRISDQLLRGDAAIVPGAPLNVRAVERAIKNLYATGQFEDVRVACERTAGKTVLTFALRERPILQDVDVRGADRVSPSEVRDRVDILIGRPVDPAQVAKDVARIDSLYEA